MQEEDIQQFSFTTPKLEPIPEAEEGSNPSELRSSQDTNANREQNLSQAQESVASSHPGYRPEDAEREERYRNIIDSFEEKKRKMNEMIKNQMRSLNMDVSSDPS